MKTFITLAIVGLMSSCVKTDQEINDYNTGKANRLKTVLVTIEIDSCESLTGHVPDGDYGWVMTHKGNCKNPIHNQKQD